ncbi:MAG: membrane protein insertase YidC [candidate division Zixibacteria bacterium]|nr:membrane protein insertase YidC [candidate division Zixibacteria bacterium]
MNRNTILAFIIIGIIIVLMGPYQEWLAGPEADKPIPEQIPVESDSIPETTAGASTEIHPTVVSPIKAQVPIPTPTNVVDQGPVKKITINTDLYTAVFSTKGASLVSLVLKKYVKGSGEEIDLVGLAPEGTLRLKNDEGYLYSEVANYAVDRENLELSVGNSEGQIVFKWTGPSGQYVEKKYNFTNSRYSFSTSVSINGAASLGCTKGYYLCWDSPMPITELSADEDNNYMTGYSMFGDEILDFDDVDEKDGLVEQKSGMTDWVASRSKYFATAIIPKSKKGAGFYIHGKVNNEIHNGKNVERKFITTGLKMVPDGSDSISDNFIVYTGPIDYYILKSYEVGLDGLVSMGWQIIQPFSIAVLWVFTQLHKFIPNYGFVIIVFSILIKVIFFPLSRKSTTSMAKMQEVQPKLKEMQEKYKNDRNKLNQETMKLYKEHGVNPLGGCLPLVFQMPVFYALFTVFRSTIELRGAAFIFWIKDLSLMDPYYILPVIMGITMFIQQKMTMKDPKQKMLVYIMPAFFIFIFYSMPAGLVLYWTMYNILSFLEQMYVKSKTSPSV